MIFDNHKPIPLDNDAQVIAYYDVYVKVGQDRYYLIQDRRWVKIKYHLYRSLNQGKTQATVHRTHFFGAANLQEICDWLEVKADLGEGKKLPWAAGLLRQARREIELHEQNRSTS